MHAMQRAGSHAVAYDGARAVRMGGFGAAIYGPLQHYWYQNLERMMPTMSLQSFGSKVGKMRLWGVCFSAIPFAVR